MKDKKKSFKKALTTIVKIGVSALLFYFVTTKISFQEVFVSISKSNYSLLIASGFFLLASQFVSAIRLNLFFHSIDYKLSLKSNFILYLIGMFYNFFIPGGIGGDAYKVFLLKKHFDWKPKKLTAALFVDRFSGLIAIAVLMCILAIFVIPRISFLSNYQTIAYILLVLSAIASFFIGNIFTKKVFPSFKKVYTTSFLYSLAIQILQLISITLIVFNYAEEDNLTVYLLVFLISVILSLISFAGIGAREIVFYQAAYWLDFKEEISVSIGLIFTFLTILISSVGIFFEFRKKKLRLIEE